MVCLSFSNCSLNHSPMGRKSIVRINLPLSENTLALTSFAMNFRFCSSEYNSPLYSMGLPVSNVTVCYLLKPTARHNISMLIISLFCCASVLLPEARLFFTSHRRGGVSSLQLNCLISPSTVRRHISGRLPLGLALPLSVTAVMGELNSCRFWLQSDFLLLPYHIKTKRNGRCFSAIRYASIKFVFSLCVYYCSLTK